jgi:transcriptional regulator with XRE-family HTH domain
MGTKDRRTDEATRRARRALTTLGADIRQARTAAGLSQAHAGAAAGMSHTQVSRIESGRATGTGVPDLARLAAIVGLDISLRAYAGPDPLRDAAHLRLLERFLACISAALQWRVEVPIGRYGDRRAWDAVLFGAGPRIAVEAETRLVDVQMIERRIALKRRDSGIERVILLLADTRWNRNAVTVAGARLVASFPVPGSQALALLATGTDPGGSSVVLL